MIGYGEYTENFFLQFGACLLRIFLAHSYFSTSLEMVKLDLAS